MARRFFRTSANLSTAQVYNVRRSQIIFLTSSVNGLVCRLGCYNVIDSVVLNLLLCIKFFVVCDQNCTNLVLYKSKYQHCYYSKYFSVLLSSFMSFTIIISFMKILPPISFYEKEPKKFKSLGNITKMTLIPLYYDFSLLFYLS